MKKITYSDYQILQRWAHRSACTHARACVYAHTRTHPCDLKNAKAAALVNTTAESSSSFMLIVSVSFICARENNVS